MVVQGEGAENNVRTRSATQPVVEVRDEGDKPVPGAEVVFQLPPAGPGGVFNGWMRTQTARTGPEGRAQANGFAPNDEEGRFNIRVTATSGTKTSNAIIAQTNTRGTGNGGHHAKSNKKLWTIIAIVGVAALTGGIIAATRGGDSNSSETVSIPVTISPGPVTVGGPR
ncbi:MAG TPA: hypothetical protein VL285_02655 [Bryobacteraceae bacterium]|nr:hypothetical protein [Bryobacteraceae bacterium]